MSLLSHTIAAPLAVEVGHGTIDRVGEILTRHQIHTGAATVVVVGEGVGRRLGHRVRTSLDSGDLLSITGGTLDSANALAESLRGRQYQTVVAVGGGRVIDTVKYAASQLSLPMISVATSLAHDGIASPVSVLESAGSSVSYGARIPLAAIVDLEQVRSSPARQTRSGIGDALSNLSAAADWELAARQLGEPIDGLALTLARTGAEALLSHPGTIEDDDFLLVLANALILGGIAMSVAGSSRPCSGGCHEIAHALTRHHPNLATHGEQAGLGALFCTYLRRDQVRFDQLRAAAGRHRLPRTPAELGLTVEQFTAAVLAAPATRPGRYTILEHLDLGAEQTAREVEEFVHAIG